MIALNAEQVMVDSLMGVMVPLETPGGWTLDATHFYPIMPLLDNLRDRIVIFLESLGEEPFELEAPGSDTIGTLRWWPFQWTLTVWNNDETLLGQTATLVRDCGAAISDVLDRHPLGGVDPDSGVRVVDMVRLPVSEGWAMTARERLFYRRIYPFRLREHRIVHLEPF